MVATKDSEPAPQGDQAPASALPGVELGVEPGAPTSPRRRWCSWRQEQPGPWSEGSHQHRHHWHHIHHWHHVGPQQTGGDQDSPPRDWQQWHERRGPGHCPWRNRPSCASKPRGPLDDSRWLEDYFAWY